MGRELPQIGDVVAHKYRVERELGRGGMGSVFAATHLVTGRTVALKCLLPQAALQPGALERFHREAATIGRIQHRYVIDVFDTLEDDGLFCIVMPFVEGISYAELLHAGIPLNRALGVLARVIEGVAAAHAVGVVHRDLKPSNVLVCRGESGELDEPRVLDFGISKLVASQDPRLTESGAALGTPLYMALEQLTGAPDIDARTDVFALGLILYETVTGRLPHIADNLGALAVERVTSPVPPLRMLCPELPEALADVIMRCLSNERADRPGLRELLAAVLRAAAAHVEGGCARAHAAHGVPTEPDGSAAPQSYDPPAGPSVPGLAPTMALPSASPRVRDRLGWLVGSLLVLAFGAGAVLSSRGAERPQPEAPQQARGAHSGARVEQAAEPQDVTLRSALDAPSGVQAHDGGTARPLVPTPRSSARRARAPLPQVEVAPSPADAGAPGEARERVLPPAGPSATELRIDEL